MKIKVNRRWKKANYTIGDMYCDGIRLFNTLEDRDRGINSSMPVGIINQIKVAGETAIPTGTYEVVLSYSPKFANKTWAKKYGGLVPEIKNVKAYSGVRIHPLTTAKDTQGCIGVGENKAVGKLLNSTRCYYELMDKHLMPAWSAKEKIEIVIK